MMKITKRNISFPLSMILISVLIGVIITLFVLISLLFYYQNEDMSRNVARQFEITVSSQVINEFETYFYNAQSALIGLEALLMSDKDLIDINSVASIHGHMEALLQADVQLNALYIANYDGDFYMAKRMPDLSISTRHVFRKDNSIISIWDHQNEENKYIFPLYAEDSIETGYNPRVRPWFKNAQAEDITWSEPYIFSSDKLVGITGTKRLFFDNFQGVISVDVGLNYLSDFIDKMFFSYVGAILVLDSEDQVIAYKDSFLNATDLERLDYSKLDSIVTLDNLKLSNEMQQTLLQDQLETTTTWVSSKGIIKILSDFFFQNTTVNSLDYLNANNDVFAKDFVLDSQRFIYRSSVLDSVKGLDWRIFFLIRASTLVGGFQNVLKLSILLLVAFFLLVLFFYSKYLKSISLRIQAFSSSMQDIVQLKWDSEYVGESDRLIKISELETMGNVYKNIIKSLESFKKFVPQTVIQYSIQHSREIDVFMELKENITFLFSDIYAFTTITEKYSPLELSKAMNIYFTELSAVIQQEHGIIDKFIGDSIMAMFGVFDKQANSAEQACIAALRMQLLHEKINRKIAQESSIKFFTRIGINTGNALVGILGSNVKLNYTAIGDAVNIASRLEGLNKQYNSKILISESTQKLLNKEFFVTQKIDEIQVKGKHEKTVIYKLMRYSTKTSDDSSHNISQDDVPVVTKETYYE